MSDNEYRAMVSSLLDCHDESKRDATVGTILEHYDDFVDLAVEVKHRFWLDEHGVLRWKPDPLVLKLFDTFVGDVRMRATHGGLNTMWSRMLDRQVDALTEREMRRLYRCIGYSLCGYADVWHEERGGISEPKGEELAWR